MTIKKQLKALKIVPDRAPHSDAFFREMEVDVLARTLWGEARGEGIKGMEAVACVILNRVRFAKNIGGYWWGDSIIKVCQKPYQFSCWNKKDPNFPKLITVDREDLFFGTALRVARRAAAGAMKDCTGGATHYHAPGVTPNWAKDQYFSVEIGQHRFYKLI